MEVQDTFQNVLQQVADLQHEWDSNNTPAMQQRGVLIRTHGPRLVRQLVSDLDQLTFFPEVEGRDGTGRKSRVPWIRVYDRQRSPKATEGWYVVFLFAADGSSVFLSLNQGTTTFENGSNIPKAREYISQRVAWARGMVGVPNDNRLVEAIALHDSAELGPSYERGNVYAYEYSSTHLPNDEQVAKDLSQLLSMLVQLYENESSTTDVQDDSAEDFSQASPDLTLLWERLLKETLWDANDLHELIHGLGGDRRQIILAGPPGTGKTRVAFSLAQYLAEGDASRYRLVQFHPSFGYEEFIEGLRPAVIDGTPVFQIQPGVIKQMAALAMKTERNSVLVIDELNRANIPRVFGELMFLLEYRDQPIDLQYSGDFSLPGNLLIIGTMNTADRSIRSIDLALRRRFDIFHCPPNPSILERYYQTVGKNSVPGLIDGFVSLNEAVTSQLDKHHAIGHTFFMTSLMTPVQLLRVWNRQVLPLIEEYFFDQPDIAAQYTIQRFWPLL